MKSRIVLMMAALLVSCSGSSAQTRLPEVLTSRWGVLIFVSTKMPRDSIVKLARDAALADATLVLRGFPDKPGDIDAYQRYVAEINRACCGKAMTKWEIHPKLFETYGVTETPAFVLANSQTSEVVKVSGDMRLGQALKFMAQQSKSPRARESAGQIYGKAFTGRE